MKHSDYEQDCIESESMLPAGPGVCTDCGHLVDVDAPQRQWNQGGPVGCLTGSHPWIPGGCFVADPSLQERLLSFFRDDPQAMAETLARDVIAFAQFGGMPDTYWQTDSRIARACRVLKITPEEARDMEVDL